MSPVGRLGHSPPLRPPFMLPRPPLPAIQPPLLFPVHHPFWATPNQHTLPIIASIYDYAFEHILIKPSCNDCSGRSLLSSRNAYGEKEVRINKFFNILVNATISNNSKLLPALPVTLIDSFPSLTLPPYSLPSLTLPPCSTP